MKLATKVKSLNDSEPLSVDFVDQLIEKDAAVQSEKEMFGKRIYYISAQIVKAFFGKKLHRTQIFHM